MSTGREKDQKDFDLEQIVRVIDAALESDDQRIKDALRALMTITVLCTAEHPDQAFKGLLARLLEDHNNLNRRLSMIEDDVRKMQWDQGRAKQDGHGPFTPPYNPGGPFGPNPTTGWPGPTNPKPMWGPSYTSAGGAGDDPAYNGAIAGASAEEFIKSLEGR